MAASKGAELFTRRHHNDILHVLRSVKAKGRLQGALLGHYPDLGLADARALAAEYRLTPCLRHRSATETPASCSFKMPMMWSSVNLLRFISGPLGWARVYLKLD